MKVFWDDKESFVSFPPHAHCLHIPLIPSPSLRSQNYYTPEELALYREQRERERIAAEKRQAELQALREQLAERRRQQQNL